MFWNYRLVKHRVTERDDGTPLPEDLHETFVEVREVHYQDDGTPMGHTSACLFGETEEEARQVLEWVAQGCAKPVLDFTSEAKRG